MAHRVLAQHSLVWPLTLGLLAAACSRSSGEPAKQPDGSYQLSCSGPLSDCLQRVEHLCKDEGYVVVEARDRHEVLGHEQGQSQVDVRKSEAIVFCGGGSQPPPRAMVEVKGEPVTRPARERSAQDANPYPEPERACVPGITQACIGPGGCTGGQACAADGMHFEACDCGPPKP
jgi:hypothetical protein